MIIGGEHTFSPTILLKRPKGFINSLITDLEREYHINFTFGGYYSILAIIDKIKLNFDTNSVILLPSYLCPSILRPFKIRGINYRFYKVDYDLYIDTNHLISIIDNNVKAVLFIDYFGASQFEKLLGVIDILKHRQITVIQDVVQCLEMKKERLFGDYIFNSFRKFFPFEGSILLSKNSLFIEYSNSKNKFVTYKRIGQIIRYLHIHYGIFSSRLFLYFLKKAEDRYYSNSIIRMPKFNLKQLNKYDIESMTEKQKYYYHKLMITFGNKVPGLLKSNNFVPLGFVIKVEKRNEIRRFLFDHEIYPPIHWILSEEIDKNIFEKSIQLSSEIMTLPLIGLTETKYNYLLYNLTKYHQ